MNDSSSDGWHARLLEWTKVGVGVAATVLGFLLIDRPESVLNRQASRETIARERAKLLLDLVREESASIREQGFRVVRAAYHDDEEDWLDEVQFLLEQQTQFAKAQEEIDAVEVAAADTLTSTAIGELNEMQLRRAELILELGQEEKLGVSPSEGPVRGPASVSKRQELTKLNTEINAFLKDVRAGSASW